MRAVKNNKYEEGTVALLNVKNVKNVRGFRRRAGDKFDWAFSPIPELGLTVTCANDEDVEVVKVLEVEGTPPPEAKTYDVNTMTAREIQTAIENTVGVSGEDNYYNESVGTDGFWHLLAGSKRFDTGDKYSHGVKPEGYTYVSDGVLVIDSIGTFTRVDFKQDYNESGDLDSYLVFKLGDRYFGIKAALDSWSGGNWEYGLHEVKPVEKTITVWEKA